MLSAARRAWRLTPAAAAAAVVIAAFLVISWSFYNGHQQSCEARGTTLNVLRNVIVTARQVNLNRHLTPEQKRVADRFYRTVFARIDNARC